MVATSRAAQPQYTMRDLVQLIVGEENAPTCASLCRRRSTRCSRLKTWSSVIPARFASSCTAAKWWHWPVERGAGQEEIGRALFGMRTVDSGQVNLFGKRLEVGSPMEPLPPGFRCGR